MKQVPKQKPQSTVEKTPAEPPSEHEAVHLSQPPCASCHVENERP